MDQKRAQIFVTRLLIPVSQFVSDAHTSTCSSATFSRALSATRGSEMRCWLHRRRRTIMAVMSLPSRSCMRIRRSIRSSWSSFPSAGGGPMDANPIREFLSVQSCAKLVGAFDANCAGADPAGWLAIWRAADRAIGGWTGHAIQVFTWRSCSVSFLCWIA